jgi:hypothetical protein
MIEEIENPSVYAELATTAFLRNSIFVIMLDFTSPWTFIVEVEKWVKFIYELQKMAQISIAELEEMARASTFSGIQPRNPTGNTRNLSLMSKGNSSTSSAT